VFVKNNDCAVIVLDLIKTIHVNRDLLSKIDGKIGDGDHGINMDKGFTICEKKLKDKTYNMSKGFSILGSTLLEDIGGSMGPLYGIFFDSLAQKSMNREKIDKIVFQDMLNTALEGVQDIGSASIGDKTLLDTLIPARNAYKKAVDDGESFYNSLEKMKAAAKKGCQSTKNMIAKVGRASRLGERSRGVLDAGATSCYLILNSIAESLQSILKNNRV